jgi:Zn-dependent protease with chaperone function
LGARPGSDAELARAENLVDGLCATMGLEPPDILVIDESTRQALALGRKSGVAVLVVTSGLLDALDPVSLEGVLAHELVHVKRADIAPATMAAAMLLPVAGFIPVSGLVHTLAGRGREFRTDRLAVAVTRFPPGLHDALVLMAEGPAPRAPSALTRRGVARATRWLWTVALPETPGGDVMSPDVAGELDAPAVRLSTLAEW